MKPLNMILAAAENNAIGRKGGIPWHIREDFLYFKRTTLGHTVIMGYMTWVSLGSKPLPGRKNYVISIPEMMDGKEPENPTDPAKTGKPWAPGTEVRFFPSLEEAIDAAQDDPFIIGGGYTYRLALPMATRIYLTRIHTVIPDADTFFPELPADEWRCSRVGEMLHDDETNFDFEFLIYDRIR
jgi:dihydrofolate reductase